MAGNKLAGVDVLLHVKDGQNTTVIGGQSGATLNRTTNVIETTSKDAMGWAESVAGVRSWSVECEGFMVMDDAALDVLEQKWMANESLEISLVFPSGKKYEGTVIISEFPNEFPQDDAVTFSLSLTGTGALEVTAAAPVVAAAKSVK